MKSEYTFKEFSKKDIARAILSNISKDYRPVIEFLEGHFLKSTSFGLLTSTRIIFPAIELASKLEGKEPAELLDIFEVPEPEIAWSMFRHGLMHSEMAFRIEKGGQSYSWGFTSGVGDKGGGHELMGEIIMLSPRGLMNDLEKYVQKFENDETLLKIQTGIKFTN